MAEKAEKLPNLNSNFKQSSVKICGVLVSCWKSVKDSHRASLCMKNSAMAYCTNLKWQINRKNASLYHKMGVLWTEKFKRTNLSKALVT